MNKVIHTGALVAQWAVSICILAAGIGLSWALIGSGRAMARAAEVRSNLIPLDPITRQYPLFLQHIGKGRFTLTNPNVNATLLLDTRNETDRQMILAMGAVQYAGALAKEARLSLKPGEVSIIQPPQRIEVGANNE